MKPIDVFAVIFVLFASPVLAGDKPVIDAELRELVVNRVAAIMQDKYVFADTGEQMANHIRQQNSNGIYDSFSEVKPFCKKLTADLREISHDKHLWVFYSPEEALEVRTYKGMLPEKETREIKASMHAWESQDNFGFKKVEILDGNIGYFELRRFTSPEVFDEKLAGVMNFLSNTNAIIIDLRKNGGGEGSSLLSSYFLPPEKILLGKSNCRDSTLNTQDWTREDVPGRRLPDTDLYILTSSAITFSAAEAFAYGMKHLKRAVIVGETTRGGAHPVDISVVEDDILTQFPICESYNPVTQSNWEGVGVKPDMEVTSENALFYAHLAAIRKIMAQTPDLEYKHELESLLDKLGKQYATH